MLSSRCTNMASPSTLPASSCYSAPVGRCRSLLDGSLSNLHSVQVRTATKKASGTAKNGRDSQPKYLGVKLYGGQVAKPGSIIVRQRGTKMHMGEGVKMGKDHTIYSVVNGKVQFFYCTRRKRQLVSVLPPGSDMEAFKERMRPLTTAEYEVMRHKITAMKELRKREKAARDKAAKEAAMLEKYPYASYLFENRKEKALPISGPKGCEVLPNSKMVVSSNPAQS